MAKDSSGKTNPDPSDKGKSTVASTVAQTAQPMQLPGAVPPSPVGARMPNFGTFNNPSSTPSLASAPTPPPRPATFGRAAPAAAAGGALSMAANPPLPPVRPQDLGGNFGGGMPEVYSPLQVGNVRGGAPASYTSADLGDILSRIFGRG